MRSEPGGGSEWKVTIVNVAAIPSLPLRQFLPSLESDATFDVPCLAFVVTNGRDAILVDTGPDPQQARRHGFETLPAKGPGLVEALASNGFEPKDVSTIVHTHLHYDHIQNDAMFASGRIVVNAEEVEYAARRPDPFYLSAGAIADVGTESPSQRWVVVDGDVDVAPGVRVIHTRGHTPGHQSVLVRTRDGVACISGDITPLERNLREPPQACPDPTGWERFVGDVAEQGWTLLPSHDPDYVDRSFG